MKLTSIFPAFFNGSKSRGVSAACGITPEAFAACSSQDSKPSVPALTDEEQRICQAAGVSPEEFQALKAASNPPASALTEGEQKICNATGISPEEYQSTKTAKPHAYVRG